MYNLETQNKANIKLEKAKGLYLIWVKREVTCVFIDSQYLLFFIIYFVSLLALLAVNSQSRSHFCV